MKKAGKLFKQVLGLCVSCICFIEGTQANPGYQPVTDTAITASRQQAIALVDNIKELEPSPFWPNIKPALFLQNLKTNIHQPVSIYAGSGTNFCGYGALTYLFLQENPLGYVKIILELYRTGRTSGATVKFHPSSAVKKAAGLLKFKGILDIHPADQMWFLTLADHFKGYLNIFNRNYDPGDEDRFWASVNYAKFNRMTRTLLHCKIYARGSDLFRPGISDPYAFISEKMETATVVLFINNRVVHKKNHNTLKLGVPTHFIVAERISKVNNVITFVYWDYGGKTLLQLSPAFFKRVIFGISYFTKVSNDAK